MAKRGRRPKTGTALIITSNTIPPAPDRKAFAKELSDALKDQQLLEPRSTPRRTTPPANVYNPLDMDPGDTAQPEPQTAPPETVPPILAAQLYCSKGGKPMLAELKGTGPYICTRVEKLSNALPADSLIGDANKLNSRDINFEQVTCPHCSAEIDGPINCRTCSRQFCRGAVDGDFFKCPCGAFGRLVQRSFDLNSSALGSAQMSPRGSNPLLFFSQKR